MNRVLIALAGTAAAVALTWFFCLRPMPRREHSTPDGCCAGPAQSIDDRIRDARKELAQLKALQPDTGGGPIPPPRREA